MRCPQTLTRVLTPLLVAIGRPTFLCMLGSVSEGCFVLKRLLKQGGHCFPRRVKLMFSSNNALCTFPSWQFAHGVASLHRMLRCLLSQSAGVAGFFVPFASNPTTRCVDGSIPNQSACARQRTLGHLGCFVEKFINTRGASAEWKERSVRFQ